MEKLKPGTKYIMFMLKQRQPKDMEPLVILWCWTHHQNVCENVLFVFVNHVRTEVQLAEHWPSASIPSAPTSST